MTLSYTSFVPPTGNIAPAVHRTNFNSSFGTTATFSGGNCAPGEYRQYVKGTFKVNGTTLDHILCGSVRLLETVFQEDGCPSGSCTAYGHRSCPQDAIDQYAPDRARGCQFSMSDAPGFSHIEPGKTYNLDLSFEGKLIDTSRGAAVLVSSAWTTSGSTTVPATVATAKTVGLAATDSIVGAHRARNAESGATELHIVIIRPAGQPPLDAAAVPLVLIDAAGRRLPTSQPPSVYEVGGRARSTVSIVYTLAGASVPVTAELMVNGGLVTLKVDTR
jgi:hypothetical protein